MRAFACPLAQDWATVASRVTRNANGEPLLARRFRRQPQGLRLSHWFIAASALFAASLAASLVARACATASLASSI